jgi:hypothetical protein
VFSYSIHKALTSLRFLFIYQFLCENYFLSTLLKIVLKQFLDIDYYKTIEKGYMKKVKTLKISLHVAP